jgi:hypothetical protein
MKPKRGYSRAFTPRGAGRGFYIGRIPTTLLQTAQAKAKREGVSLRALMLEALQRFIAGTGTSDERMAP